MRLRAPFHAGYRDLLRADSNLETAYIIRLFAEFEGILRLALSDSAIRAGAPHARRTTGSIAPSVSSPSLDPIHDAVHGAREYRNSVVHPGGVRIASLSLRQARSILNRFLKPLP